MSGKKVMLLTDQTHLSNEDVMPLANVKPLLFRMSIERKLDNKYDFGDMKQKGIKDFHRFIQNTVGKGLSISEVDSLYLRKRGLSKTLIKQTIDGIERDIFHYGQDRQPFRIFGFYGDEHFVITKIDCNHATNK